MHKLSYHLIQIPNSRLMVLFLFIRDVLMIVLDWISEGLMASTLHPLVFELQQKVV